MSIYTRQTMTLWTSLDEHGIRDALAELHEIDVKLSNDRLHAVNRARALGLSWEEIGSQLGMTRQAVWDRYHHIVGL